MKFAPGFCFWPFQLQRQVPGERRPSGLLPGRRPRHMPVPAVQAERGGHSRGHSRRHEQTRCLLLLLRVANPSERKKCPIFGEKKAPSLVKKMPQMQILLHKGFKKMPNTHKKMRHFFRVLLHFYLTKENAPLVVKMPFFPKNALKMPGWQHCCYS